MREKKAGSVIIIVAFIVIICLSRLIWFFAEKHLDSENHENRNLAARPELTVDNYGTFSSEYTSYFNDNLQFRNQLISLNSGIDYFIFGRSSNEHVVAGTGNWLFYSSEDDVSPIRSYEGKDLYTEEELAGIARNCVAQRDFIESQGKEFVLFIAPNKERVYWDHMPKRYGKPADTYGALQIYRYLKEHTDIRVVYPYAELMDARGRVKERLYYKTDTHWNHIGGYVGASALLSELGIEMPKIYGGDITIGHVTKVAGDLARMLNLGGQLKSEDDEYSVEGYDTHDRQELEWDEVGLIRCQATGADPRTIYVIKDSYCMHMLRYIGSQFDNSYFRSRDSYAYDELAACDPDIVVYETVERYANRLAGFSLR